MAYPNYDPPIGDFVLDTDGSNTAIGGVLSQYQNNVLRPIAFGSKTLNKSQRKYSATEIELLSLVYFLEYWKFYTQGNHIIVRVDHGPLIWAKNTKGPSKMHERWLTILQNANLNKDPNDILRIEEHDIEIKHRPGRLHTNADSMSRIPNRDAVPEEIVNIKVNVIEGIAKIH